MARASVLDMQKLRQFADNERFRAFERELGEAISQEIEERKMKSEDARRNRERKARKKRLRKQASMSSG
ncbi:MAG: hypothetical protein GTN65_08890 [Armatimonadetes bacterium]|nr:hypothetical protein [Armatimonadota bacterium]NIO97197.1 hypothetical protein [Armatimonadota bacterium]